ncbi:hypothetical protein LCGC14_2198040 [marine sediment metagenome]|uniref:Uncharacterized protein n=1 Tax=marine sediment metagenome TaxID=412755 RepID=A0A0F9E4P2_9ZZZZ
MPDRKTRAKQLQRLNKPKKPVVLLKGNKRKPKVIIPPKAGIPAGLAEAARKAKVARAARDDKVKVTPKKKLPRPKNPAPPFPNERGEFDAAGKVGVSERSTLE